jgi:hypothetical protein
MTGLYPWEDHMQWYSKAPYFIYFYLPLFGKRLIELVIDTSMREHHRVVTYLT